ncbi:MAG: DUF4236 domain-containing protein [Bacteroidales bacterium]|nr:DUF4236 domain-containing protein [Bacteroidales bacterium]
MKHFKLKNLFAKRILVADGVRVPVSRHFYYSTFGVRGRNDNIARTANYVQGDTPGTGFFSRSSESHSYRRFVTEERKKTKQNPMTLLLGKEPNFDKEMKRVEKAFEGVDNDDKRRILSAYQNVLAQAKEEEQLQRVVRAIKDKMGGHPNKMLVSILSHYKSGIATLEHDVAATQINVTAEMTDECKEAWKKVIEAFDLIVNSRRVWSVYMEEGDQAYQQVFFDMGIFDYIQSFFDTPVMRDHEGNHYYVYPKGLIAARSSVDFDFYSWKDLDVEFNVVNISALAVRPTFSTRRSSGKHGKKHTDAISNLYGTTRAQVVGEVCIPKLGLHFYVNHTGPAEDFVKALKEFVKEY